MIARILLVTLLTLLPTIALAETPPPNPAGTVAVGDVVRVRAGGILGPGQAAVYEVRVDAQGEIRLPWIARVKLAGQTTDLAAATIAKAYHDGKVEGEAIVTVAILEIGATAPVKPGPFAAGDTVRVVIQGIEAPTAATTIHAQVAADGTIQLPLAGELKIAGLTENDAADAIVKLYSTKKVVDGADVTALRTGATRAAKQ